MKRSGRKSRKSRKEDDGGEKDTYIWYMVQIDSLDIHLSPDEQQETNITVPMSAAFQSYHGHCFAFLDKQDDTPSDTDRKRKREQTRYNKTFGPHTLHFIAHPLYDYRTWISPPTHPPTPPPPPPPEFTNSPTRILCALTSTHSFTRTHICTDAHTHRHRKARKDRNE